MWLQFLTPEILDAQASGYIADRMGNRKRDAAPQGVYPCAGEDQWVAIAVDTDEQWAKLVKALGNPDWAARAELSTTTGRLAHHDEIDTALAEWTSDQTPHAVMDRLTANSVPAGAVQRSGDLQRDPQYAHRGFHHVLEHPVLGSVPYAGNQFRIPGYAGGPSRPSPLLGEHNQAVFGGILGYSEAEIAELMESGAAR
jgi:benzylsuccinate CoA-transferase BbsF subunit